MLIYDMISKMLFFSTYIQSTTQGYLSLSVAILVSIKSVSYYLTNKKQYTVSSLVDRIVTVIMTLYLLAFPIASFIFLVRMKTRLDEVSINGKFSYHKLIRTFRFTLYNSHNAKELPVAICSDNIHGKETVVGTHCSLSL